jgi:hypothetical protein
MVEMSCEEHDRLAASSQFITHTVGRMLGRMELPDTPINTKGYSNLLSLVENTAKDSFDLYYGLFMYNENATEELARMEAAFDSVKRQLFDQVRSSAGQRPACARLTPPPRSCTRWCGRASSQDPPRRTRRRQDNTVWMACSSGLLALPPSTHLHYAA